MIKQYKLRLIVRLGERAAARMHVYTAAHIAQCTECKVHWNALWEWFYGQNKSSLLVCLYRLCKLLIANSSFALFSTETLKWTKLAKEKIEKKGG